MAVPMQTKHQVGELFQIGLEYFGHIVVELVVVRLGMHDDNCPFHFRRSMFEFFVEESKIGYRERVVIFQCIGLQT